MELRVATPADAGAIADIYRPYVEETAITFEETPPDRGAMADRIEETLSTHPWFVATDDGEVVGYAYAGKLRKRAAYRWVTEVSVYVDRQRQRNGIGSALYRALLAALSEQGFQSTYAVVTLPNPDSVAFHQHWGFQQAALLPKSGYKHDEWHDVAWFERPLAGFDPAEPSMPSEAEPPRPTSPDHPRPFVDCRDASWLNDLLGPV